jgi:hypothetical protein
MASDKPFRFLDLPVELRCMVYERLNIETRLYTFSFVPRIDLPAPCRISIAVKSLSTSILASCRLAYAEAAPILTPKLERLRNDEPLHFMVDTLSFDHMFNGPKSLMMAIQKHEQNIRAYGKEAGWELSPDCDKIGILMNDERSALLLKYILKCANHTQNRHSNKMLVTVNAHPGVSFDLYLNGALGWFHQDYWQTFRAIDEVEIRLCGDKTDVDRYVQTVEADIAPEDYRTHGPWRTSIRAMENTEYNEIWSSGQKIELI